MQDVILVFKMIIGFQGLQKNDFQLFSSALCSCRRRHHRHSSKSWLTRLTEFPVTFRWIMKLVAKHKMVAAVSGAEGPNDGRWGKFTYLRSIIEQTATAECENGIRARLDAAQPNQVEHMFVILVALYSIHQRCGPHTASQKKFDTRYSTLGLKCNSRTQVDTLHLFTLAIIHQLSAKR